MVLKKLPIPNGDLVANDTEGTGLSPFLGDRTFAVSWCNEKMETGYVQWNVDPFTREVKIPGGHLRQLEDWLSNERISKVFWNAAYDVKMYEEGMGIKVCTESIEDAMIAFHTRITSLESYALKKVCKAYGIMGDDDEQDLKKAVTKSRAEAKKKGWMLGPKTETDYWMPRQLDRNNNLCEIYAVKDVIRTIKAWNMAIKEIRRNDRVFNYEWEMQEVWPILHAMERTGLRVSTSNIQEQIRICGEVRDEMQKKLAKSAGWDLNPASDMQMRKLLFEKMGLRSTVLTKKGRQPSTSSDALEPLKDVQEVEWVLKHRAYSKGITSFFGVYDEKKVKRDGCWVIMPNFRQAGKKTKRLSASDPNLQGVTDSSGGRGGSDVPARAAFIPRKGKIWLLIDYSQLEVRTFAAASRYQTLIDILRSGRDLHTEATNSIWGQYQSERAINAGYAALHKLLTEDPVKFKRIVGARTAADLDRALIVSWLNGFKKTPDGNWNIVDAEKSVGSKASRSKGKPFFFTRMFGGGKRSFSAKLNISENEAQELVDRYDETLPGVIDFVKTMAAEAKNRGYVSTLYGTMIDLPRGDEYKASPYIVQGTAADLVKRAMIAVAKFVRNRGIDADVLLQIHDELVIEIDKSERAWVALRILELMERQGEAIMMETPCSLKIVTKNWAEPEKLDIRPYLVENKMKQLGNLITDILAPF